MLPILLRVLPAHVANAETAIIADTGHVMMRQNPPAFRDSVTVFLKQARVMPRIDFHYCAAMSKPRSATQGT